MAELNSVSHARRGQVTRDQWYAEVLRLAEDAGYVSEDGDASLAEVAEFAGDNPFSPARVRGGSAAHPLAPSPVWDPCYTAELSPVEAVEGALAAVEFRDAPADDDDEDEVSDEDAEV